VASFQRAVDVAPESVWAVLEDPEAYPKWMAGKIDVQQALGSWPAAGASFDFSFLWGPFRRSGRATVLESRPPGLLRDSVVTRPDFPIDRRDLRQHLRAGLRRRIAENPHGLRSLGMSGYVWVAGPLANARSIERLEGLAAVAAR
jgi:hypothetical protein